MTKTKSTKRALLLSALSLVMCVSMLIGSTFAWFTDSVTSAGNTIQSGTLQVDLVDAGDNSMEGQIIEFVTADNRAQDEILWEPGCTYETKPVYVLNKGNLALKYQIAINGIDGDAKLLEAIEWTVTVGDTETKLADLKGTLLAGEKSEAIVLSGHMKEEAGNEYQGLTVEGISISVFATQFTHESDSFDNQYDDITLVSDADALKAAIAEGKNVMLTADVALDADETVNVAKNNEVMIDLNGKTISSVSDKTGSNRNLFDVRGTMTVFNGTITTKHTGDNMGWGNSTNVFNVTDGGVLNIKDATIENLGGSDMAFAVHLNNWGEVTLNVDNSTLASTYTAVRVFNSGNDMNNVTITNSTLMGASQSFWVHNATVADFGTQEKADAAAARLNFNFIVENPVDGVVADDTSNLVADANNTFIGKIRYGFTDGAVYFTSAEKVVAASNSALSTAISNGAKEIYLSNGEYTLPTLAGKDGVTLIGGDDTVIGGENATTGFGGNFGKNTTIKNVTFTGADNGARWTYAQGGTTVFENCTFAGDSVYGFHIDSSNGATFIFNNCTFSGFNAFASDLAKVEFNNCTFLHNGSYGHTNIWSIGEFNGCTFGEGATYGTRGSGVIYVDGIKQ